MTRKIYIIEIKNEKTGEWEAVCPSRSKIRYEYGDREDAEQHAYALYPDQVRLARLGGEVIVRTREIEIKEGLTGD